VANHSLAEISGGGKNKVAETAPGKEDEATQEEKTHPKMPQSQTAAPGAGCQT